MKRILVTGANGFVGSFLSDVLTKAGYEVLGSVREMTGTVNTCASVAVGAINAATDWNAALQDIDVVIHCAARAHVMRETTADAWPVFHSVNVDGTVNLAKQAVAHGVKRFIYLSSIKVNGEQTCVQPFYANDPAHPEDAYGHSKWEAEQALQTIGAATGLEIVIIRPPLIYGPGVKGNLLRLLRWIDTRRPLPLGSVQNARSLVGLGNLCDLIRVCVEHQQAAGEVFLVADGDDLSTPQLLRHLAAGLHKPLLLLPVPVAVLRWLGKSLGVSDAIARLTGDLRVDIGKNRELLGWTPPYPVASGIAAMCNAYTQAAQGKPK